MKHKLALITLILLASALAGCKLLTGPADKIVTAEDAGSTVNLIMGDELVVELEGNPTTGYEWEVTEVDEAVLVPLGEPDYQSESEAIGAGGLFTFYFEAAGPGETELQLVYHRPWEEDVEPEDRFVITVIVEEDV